MKRQHHNSLASTAFKEKVLVWATKVRVKPGQIRLQKMTAKWASCSPTGRLTFSEDLVRESGSFQDYVIVHELLHLKIPNHGKLFKSLLSAHVPGWRRLILNYCHVSAGDNEGGPDKTAHYYLSDKQRLFKESAVANPGLGGKHHE